MTTIKEIAQRAGVGTTTVSRYLNQSPHISEQAKQKIEKAINELDYVPSASAKYLRKQETKQIGVVVSRITNPYFSSLFNKIERILNQFGYEASIMQTYDNPIAERKIIDKLKNQTFDALLMASIEDKDYIKSVLQENGNKIVLVNETINGCEKDSVSVDQYTPVVSGLEYLNKNYGSEIVYITGSNFFENKHGNQRNKAYREFLQKHQYELNQNMIFSNAHNIADGKEIAQKLLVNSSLPNAIFTNSDEVAIGVIAELKSKGIQVPEEVAVMGFDDQPLASYVQVPLTTIQQPINALANNACRLLLNKLQVSHSLMNENLQLSLIIRQSA
ncbi:LacI family DNA-binding transcriptional regulator [Lactobacillus mulieris]|jgi:transcription regulator|uniref:LacI family DNA-binding transcriptional regulator n=1 Tax=Lactobacillus mulieris TaxID=2508708 RepID=UPI0001B2AD6A|nr:LacI family DNA-binding transcriptional regulator [Lactobacillus mulieris]EEU21307.1 hypothetical protein HMPREF0525_00241 [Lactobacillus jensenii 27-2-CHN]EEX24182.1 transcriptional regulator, LacI family [Lactobacillus jensenii 115-3-CHN]KAA9370793.1 LacI family transcriptional regulator [Lactobacillus jensenii]MCW8073619.1 LacI family transcriptional regulator [Lactobacillus mulieris]MCW8106603.1 LacI family transcriptional regulator [Lactobacillus mulieris]